jgi:hypothetical protein
MTLAVFLLLKMAPFSLKTKIVIVASSAFMYFLPVISRDYCLIALALVCVCITYQHRMARPIMYALALALLLQSHYLAMPAAIVLSMPFIFKYLRGQHLRRGKIGVVAIISASFVADVICVLPVILSGYLSYMHAPETIVDYSVNVGLFGVDLPLLQFFFLGVFGVLLLYYRRVFFWFCVAVASHVFILNFVYNVNPASSKDVILLHYAIAAIWLTFYEPRHIIFAKIKRLEIVKLFGIMPPAAFVVLPCLASIPLGVRAAIWDISNQTSISIRAANYINEHLPDDAILVDLKYQSAAHSLLPLLSKNIRIYDPYDQHFIEYVAYGAPKDNLTAAELEARVTELDAGAAIYYLLYAYALCDAADNLPDGAQEIFSLSADESPFLRSGESNMIIFRASARAE